MNPIKIDLSGLPDMTNETYYPLYGNRSRYLVMMGGGGSGKSVFASQKLIYRMLTERGHRFLVLRKVAKTLRDSVFSELTNTINIWGLNQLFQVPKGRSSDIYIRCVNGNEILFAGLDDVEKLKSIRGITGIWIEEASEIEEGDLRQLDIRLRGKTIGYKQILITFNPIDVNHWLKKEYFDKPKQGATTHHSTYKSNRFLPEEDRKVLEAFKGVDDYYYQVYCLGEWGVLGKTIFPAAIVSKRISELRDQVPLRRGFFIFDYENDRIVDDTIQWMNDPNGYITIYEDPIDRNPYVAGGDTAGEGSDYFSGPVVNNVTGLQAAVLHHQFDEDLYTRQMYCLGNHYNDALIGIESNFSTFPNKEIQRLGYINLYTREVPDTFTGRVEKKYGFMTSKLSRPLIIANLVKTVREHPEWMMDIPTLNEMLTFVRNEKGKPEAKEGSHDDLLMGLAIAHHIRGQQDYEIPETPDKPKEKLIDKLKRR